MTAGQARARLEGRPAVWTSGHFDPVLAEHVRLLRGTAEQGKALVVEITSPEQPLLSARARAELVAALAIVDLVVLDDGAKALPSEDSRISRAFVEHVLQRHSQEKSRANGR